MRGLAISPQEPLPGLATISNYPNAQLGRISASIVVSSGRSLSLRSARMPIMAALSVQRLLPASNSVSRSRSQAAVSLRRRARLQVTPPEAVTQPTRSRRAGEVGRGAPRPGGGGHARGGGGGGGCFFGEGGPQGGGCGGGKKRGGR